MTGENKKRSHTIPAGVAKIDEFAFFGSDLQSVVIPESVTEIGGGAFLGCTNLRRVVIPDSVTKIWQQAFACCESLRDIVIPDSVTEIGKSAFDGCWQLMEASIPRDCILGDNAFPEKCLVLRRRPEADGGENTVPLPVIAGDLSASSTRSDDVDRKICCSADAATVIELMKNFGCSVTLTDGNDIHWLLDDIHAYIIFDDGTRQNPDLVYRCSYSIGPEKVAEAIILSNQYNAAAKHGKSWVQYDDDKSEVCYQLPMILSGGVTYRQFSVFFCCCTTFMKDWKSRVVDKL